VSLLAVVVVVGAVVLWLFGLLLVVALCRAAAVEDRARARAFERELVVDPDVQAVFERALNV